MKDTEFWDRARIATAILNRLDEAAEQMRAEFATPGRIPSCTVDNLVPEALAGAVHAAFPASGRMSFKNTVRERKYVSAQMNEHPPILEEAVYAFQDPRIVARVGEITQLRGLEPDADLYAGGISAMPKGSYLRPHLDNSHDKDQQRYRALNLLWYVTPDWQESYGGSFEMWDDGPKGHPRTVPARFNRLLLMATNRTSWHSVSEVTHDGSRCCVSNYYFSAVSQEARDYFHATSFRGRPGEVLTDLALSADGALRTGVLRTLGSRVYRNPHVYDRRKPKRT